MEVSPLISNLKATASRVFARKDAYINAARPYAERAATYAKENPSDVMLGIMTLLLMDIESDVDDLEDHTGVSAAVDLHDYHSR
jgi:hypothetical protein